MKLAIKAPFFFIGLMAGLCVAIESEPSSANGTSTEWRDDEKNLIVVRELSRAYSRLPFSREYEGVEENRCPFALTWETGPNLRLRGKEEWQLYSAMRS